MKQDTKCVQSGYSAQNGDPRVLPISQSTTYQYDSTEHVGKLFDLSAPGHMYSRISNPTLDAVENKIADLEGGVGAMLCASGQSALTLTLLNIMRAGDHLVSTSEIYGGSVNLLTYSLKKIGINVTCVPADDLSAIDAAIQPNTKAVFGESIANPALSVLDIKAVSDIAHKHGVPLIVDNTFPTPVLLKPFNFGADIVTHSTTKYMDGHAVAVGGCIVDSGNFVWAGNPRFPEFNAPDSSYHGLVYPDAFGKLAFIAKARVQMMRDYGCIMSPQNAFYLNLGLETLHLRMERHCSNALKVAEFLSKNPKVEWVKYPMLNSDPHFPVAKRLGLKGASGVVCFGVRGGKNAAVRCMDAFKLAKIVVHVADVRTCVLHPASATHRQLSDAQLVAAGVRPEMIRLSVGIEHPDDIIADLAQALDCV